MGRKQNRRAGHQDKSADRGCRDVDKRQLPMKRSRATKIPSTHRAETESSVLRFRESGGNRSSRRVHSGGDREPSTTTVEQVTVADTPRERQAPTAPQQHPRSTAKCAQISSTRTPFPLFHLFFVPHGPPEDQQAPAAGPPSPAAASPTTPPSRRARAKPAGRQPLR